MADFYLSRRLPHPMNRRFDHIVAQDLADSERALRQDGDDLLLGNDFDVLLNARVFSAREVASVGNSGFAEGFSRKQIHLDDAGLEVRDFRDVHAERPHRLQWCVNDDCLRGAKR